MRKLFNFNRQKKQTKKDDVSLLAKLMDQARTGKEAAMLEEERLYREGTVKVIDFIAPSALGISSSYLQIGTVYVRTLLVAAYPKILPIGWVGAIINMDRPMDVSLYIHPIKTEKILKTLRKKATQIESEINIEAEKGLTRNPVLEMAYRNVEDLRDRLMEGAERFFRFALYVNIFGQSPEELDENTGFIEAILNARSIFTKKAVFRMKEGFDSCLPLGTDKLDAGINLNTAPLSTSFPFISTDLSSNEGVLYGINQHNNSLILFDRFSLENANMVIFAKSGAGKSYAVKLEILRSMMLGTSVIVIDPENEYRYLAEAVGGSFIKIALTSPSHINPFDLPQDEEENMDEILRANAANLLGLFKLMLGNITPEEESILEKAIKEAYALRDITEKTSVKGLRSRTVPLLTDFYEVLRNMKGAQDIVMRMEKYTEGIFSGFLNNPTNVNMDNQLVVFNLRDLEDELRPIAMYLVLHFIWNKVRSRLKKRLIVVDEAWWMMQYEEAARFMFSIAKRVRKYYGGLTTITQDVSDFMSSRYGKPIVSNSSLQLLMRQSQSSIDAIADTFYLTKREKHHLMECNVGEGIFFAGQRRAAILVQASPNEDRIVTTNPAQRLAEERQKQEKL